MASRKPFKNRRSKRQAAPKKARIHGQQPAIKPQMTLAERKGWLKLQIRDRKMDGKVRAQIQPAIRMALDGQTLRIYVDGKLMRSITPFMQQHIGQQLLLKVEEHQGEDKGKSRNADRGLTALYMKKVRERESAGRERNRPVIRAGMEQAENKDRERQEVLRNPIPKKELLQLAKRATLGENKSITITRKDGTIIKFANTSLKSPISETTLRAYDRSKGNFGKYPTPRELAIYAGLLKILSKKRS